MSNRTPTLSDLKNLTRDEWEDLCSLICILNYSAHRIEDHLGKGNGLDAFRETETGIEGWQIRRFNDRLALKQEKRIRENITLANDKCLLELNKPLTKFTIIFNINPEPGHIKKIGEIQRLTSIKDWAKEEYGVDFEYKGISWVLVMLLKNPTLKPELFENITESLKEISASLHAETFDIKKELALILENNSLSKELKEILNTLLKEANIHYKRGIEHESKEEFEKSIRSICDALRLIEGKDVDSILEGKILSFLSGVESTVGYLEDAVKHSERSIILLKEEPDSDYYISAKGNLAFSFFMEQKYDKAKKIFQQILLHFESSGNLLDVVRTLTHLLEIEIRTRNFEKAVTISDRILSTSTALEEVLGGANHITIASIATVANLYAEIGITDQDHIFLNKAVELYKKIEDITAGNIQRLHITAKFGRARCTWNLDQLEEAETIFKEVINDAKGFLPKVSTDAKYNLALMLIELEQYEKARQYLEKSILEYESIGDFSSVKDAQDMILRTKK